MMINSTANFRYKIRLKLLFSFFCTALFGCATYQGKVDIARSLLRDGKAAEAVQKLEPLATEEGKDQLVYVFDYATALQAAGDYQKSKKIFIKADQLAESKDYHSVTKIGASLLASEEMMQYKGDDYEKVLINAMAAIDFLMLGDYEGARVETRRVNQKLDYYRTEEKKNYEQNTFAHYLSGVIWEAERRFDDASISYAAAYKQNPSLDYLKQDLLRTAKLAQSSSRLEKWHKEFGKELKPYIPAKNNGQLVVIYLQGWGPRKGPRQENFRFPQLYPVSSETHLARVNVDDFKPEVSQEVFSVQDVAIKTLDDNYAALVAKRMAGVVVKEVAADQIRQKNEALGALVGLALHLSDRADVRHWSTLPQSFHVAKMWLPEGDHKVRIEGINHNHVTTGELQDFEHIKIKRGRITFLFWRSLK